MIKNLGFAKPRFRVISIYGRQHKNLFSTIWYLHMIFLYHIKLVKALDYFHIVTHSYPAPLSIKASFDKTSNIFLNSKSKAIYLNPLIVYESKFEIKITSPWTFSKIIVMSAVFYKQDFCLKRRWCDYFRTKSSMTLSKVLSDIASAKNIMNNYRKTIRSFLVTFEFVASWNV